MTASGIGALGGGVYLASRASVVGLGRAIAVATTVFGAGLIAFGLSRRLWLSLLILPVIGGGFMVSLAATNTIVQTITEERFRGRVMAFYAMAFLGAAPLGSLLAGILADHLGEPLTIVLGGAICIMGSAWFASRLPRLRELVRPIYVRQGIVGEPVAGGGTGGA
jgi:MFS family permease